MYNYYSPESSRSERQPPSPDEQDQADSNDRHHRAANLPQHPNFLPPPPPPHTATASSQSLNLPPFSQTFYSSYHPATTSHGSSPSTVGMNMAHTLGYSAQIPMGAPSSQPYPYPVTSPVRMNVPPLMPSHRQPPPHNYNGSPRVLGYSSPPFMRRLSPTSPTTHLIPPGLSTSTTSTASSSYPSAARIPSGPSKTKRRSGSASASIESWDDGDGRYIGVDAKGEGDEDDGEDGNGQPWGMPQDEYKALYPRDKKQVRNRCALSRSFSQRTDDKAELEHGGFEPSGKVRPC